jgi:hypothetical protein
MSPRTARYCRARRWLLTAVLAAPAILAAGCGGSRAHPAPPAPSHRPNVSPGPSLPLDHYLPSPTDSVRVARAYHLLVGACEKRFGVAADPEQPAPDGPRTANERRYGITDPALASSAGYRVSVRATAPPVRPAEARDPRTLEVLTGNGRTRVNGQPVPRGGCAGEATRRLEAGAPTDVDRYLAQRLSLDSFVASRRDPRVLTAFRSWSDCMRGHGYNYANPLAAAADPRFARGPVSMTEVTVAVTDIGCKRQTNLVETWAGVEAGLQRGSIAANRDGLEKARLLNEAELRVARSLYRG